MSASPENIRQLNRWNPGETPALLPGVIEQPRETRMSDLGSQPREVWNGRLPAEGRRGSSENTSNCLILFPALPSLHTCHLFGIRSLVS
jgi:hypothetical protein